MFFKIPLGRKYAEPFFRNESVGPDPAGEKSGSFHPAMERVAKAKGWARNIGWEVIVCSPGQYAVVRDGNETDRFPLSGSMPLEDLERFLKCQT